MTGGRHPRTVQTRRLEASKQASCARQQYRSSYNAMPRHMRSVACPAAFTAASWGHRGGCASGGVTMCCVFCTTVCSSAMHIKRA